MSLYFLLVSPFILFLLGVKMIISEKSEIMNSHVHRSNMKVLEITEWSNRQNELMIWNTKSQNDNRN